MIDSPIPVSLSTSKGRPVLARAVCAGLICCASASEGNAVILRRAQDERQGGALGGHPLSPIRWRSSARLADRSDVAVRIRVDGLPSIASPPFSASAATQPSILHIHSVYCGGPPCRAAAFFVEAEP